MSAVLLKTKLYIPIARPELVPRPHLIVRLNEGLSRSLILIAAPAGYGKTTLLSTWVAKCGQPVAWLSLEDRDNDPARFLVYLIAALQTIEADLGQDILSALQSPQPSAIEHWLPVLVNQLDNIAKPFVLVLDDYHVIATPEIHQALAFLLEHRPPQLHVAIATRKDPPLPLPRLRARGQLTELRQADLRFTAEETAAFLRRGMSLELSTEDVASLVSRTEGWIAGLQMAALSIQDRVDVSRLIATFSGSHEYIVDYFAAEVLDQQPEPSRTFLLQTSILDRLCGSLCDAVTGQTEGQQILERLHEANLFVFALDSERCWYRYHHLLSDLLRAKLHREYAVLEIQNLHHLANQWYEQHDQINEAVQHALLAEDFDRVAVLIKRSADVMIQRSELTTLLRWLDLTPA
jgi:ATP/maltotriose-dependent transcriptional regulator MalT